MNAKMATMTAVQTRNVEIQLEAIPVCAILDMRVMGKFAEVYLSHSNKQEELFIFLVTEMYFFTRWSVFFSSLEPKNMTILSFI